MEIMLLILASITFVLLLGTTIDRAIEKFKRDTKQNEESRPIYKDHYVCKNCGESIDFNTNKLVAYCPFCGEEYRRGE